VTFRAWLLTLRNAVRSYRIALRASSHFGQSIRLRKRGKLQDALKVAREGLVLLSDPVVRRQEGPEGSGVVCLTIQVEWLAQQLGEPGASEKDLADSVTFMKAIAATVKGQGAEMNAAWLPCLEARLAQMARDTQRNAEPQNNQMQLTAPASMERRS